MGNASGDSTGAFGLEVNFGSATQPPISPPATVVPQQPDLGGGVADTTVVVPTNLQSITIGSLTGEGNVYSMTTGRSNWYSTAGGLSFSAVDIGFDAPQAVAPLVVVATPQTDWQAGSLADALADSGQTGSLTPGATPSVFQALDAVLLDWESTDPLSVFTNGNTTDPSRLGLML